jgi:hypothetical protein
VSAPLRQLKTNFWKTAIWKLERAEIWTNPNLRAFVCITVNLEDEFGAHLSYTGGKRVRHLSKLTAADVSIRTGEVGVIEDVEEFSS